MVKRRWTCEGTKSPQVHLMVKMTDIDGSDHIYVSICVVLSVMVYGRRSGEEPSISIILTMRWICGDLALSQVH